MDFKSKDDVLEVCFYVVNRLLERAEEVSGEAETIEKKMFEEDYRDINEFVTRVAKAVATRVLDKDFHIHDSNSLKRLWLDEAVNVTNEMIKEISASSFGYDLCGYKFSVEKEYNHWGDEISLYIAVQDGRKEYVDDIDYIGHLIDDFVAEDILRIATGRTLSRKTCFNPDEKSECEEIRRTRDIISEIVSCFGCDISYSEIRKTIKSNKAEDGLVKLCKEIEAEYEKEVYNW